MRIKWQLRFRLLRQMLSQNPSLCAQCFEKPKLKMSEFGVRKSLLIEKVATEKMGDSNASKPPCSVDWVMVCKGLGEHVCRMAGGQVSIGGPWILAVYGRGCSTASSRATDPLL